MRFHAVDYDVRIILQTQQVNGFHQAYFVQETARRRASSPAHQRACRCFRFPAVHGIDNDTGIRPQ